MKNLIKLTLVLSVLFNYPLNAQNLIINGNFDDNITGWDYNSNNASWVSDDGASISGNGSFRFGFVIENNAFRWSVSEPITVAPGFTYELAVSAKKPAASAANYAGATIYWFDASDINISQDYLYIETFPLPVDIWENMYGAFTAPYSTSYAVIWLTLSVGGNGSPNEAFMLFDDVILLEDTVFVSDFD